MPTVEDQFEADPMLRRIPDVTVTLTSSSPLVNRPDDTDSNGTITFAALTPNPTSTNYYELSVAFPSGYVVLKSHDIDKTPTSTYARHSLAPAENWPTILRVYRPSTIFLNLTDSQSGTLFTRARRRCSSRPSRSRATRSPMPALAAWRVSTRAQAAS